MELFEIHLTGNRSIIERCKPLQLKTIMVDLFDRNKQYMRTEYMTSIAKKFENYAVCKSYVDVLVDYLQDSEICRVKIECPYYDHYVNQSIYIETHFKSDDASLPLSRNKNKDYFLATDREYAQQNYSKFRDKYYGKELELCLFDSFPEEDKDWLDNNKN